jgi:SAM-dependent methyltransferase
MARRASRLLGRRARSDVSGSAAYWERRYRAGGNSGSGSYELLAEFKAEVLNEFVASNHIQSVIEFGCGDGNQLQLAEYPTYVGYDISPTAIERCRRLFADDPTKQFHLLDGYAGETAELSMSLDVIYHLVEDSVFENYMKQLFDASTKFVAIYSSNVDSGVVQGAVHVRHRCFHKWIEGRPEWRLIRHLPNRYPFDATTGEGSFADFFFYKLNR